MLCLPWRSSEETVKQRYIQWATGKRWATIRQGVILKTSLSPINPPSLFYLSILNYVIFCHQPDHQTKGLGCRLSCISILFFAAFFSYHLTLVACVISPMFHLQTSFCSVYLCPSGVGKHCDGRGDVLPQGASIFQDYWTSQQEKSLDQSEWKGRIICLSIHIHMHW